jgi:hypothetical protein
MLTVSLMDKKSAKSVHAKLGDFARTKDLLETFLAFQERLLSDATGEKSVHIQDTMECIRGLIGKLDGTGFL